MPAIETYDAVAFGSGEAGKSMAWHLGGRGQRVAVVEERYIGGSCPNIACLPSKNIIHSASVAHLVATSAAFGTHAADVTVSMQEVQARKRAMGDCAGSPAFTHMAFEDFRIVRDNLNGGNRSTAGRQVPFCLFTDPELARVGLNETEARRQGVAYRLAELPVAAILRTRTTGETRGKLKALIGADDRIIGFTAFGPHAGEMLPPIQLAMSAGLPYQAVEALTVSHPTYAEGLVQLFSNVGPLAS